MTVALPSVDEVEATCAEITARIDDLESQLREAKAELSRWRTMAAALQRFSGGGNPTGRAAAGYGTVRPAMLELLSDGRPHRKAEFMNLGSESTVRKRLSDFVREGICIAVGRDSVQLKPPPEASPVRPERPSAPLRPQFEARPLAREVLDTGPLERLTGAAPKARCPICGSYRDAVGMQGGRYVFECDCPTPGSTKRSPRRFFNAGDGSDRPRGLS